MRIIIALALLLAGTIGAVQTGFAMDEHGDHKMMKKESGMSEHSDMSGHSQDSVVNVGNKTCPITGEPVKGDAHVVYKGKRYNVCCPGCDKEFLKDPEKYIKKLKEKGEIK